MQPDQQSFGRKVVGYALTIALALGIAAGVQAFIVKPYRIPSGSMQPTLAIGQRVLVDRLGPGARTPHVGDVVVFHPPAGADTGTCENLALDDGQPCDRETPTPSRRTLIKRVVAGPGDRIQIKDGHVIRNGRREAEPFIAPSCRNAPATARCDLPVAITVPKDHYFMMGDNRGDSNDSRFWGPLPKRWVIGRAAATYWPPSRIGTM